MTDDLKKLRIEKKTLQPGKKRKRLVLPIMIILTLLGAAGFFATGKPVEVETATVSLSYPSQDFTLLNASGYVVAQRKAAVASKITGRLEWLGVEEGSHVKKGQVLARLENRDSEALRAQAVANLASARESVEQARAEYHDAELSHGRLKGLLAAGVISASEYDAAAARLKKARAGVRGGEANVTALSAAVRAADASVEYALITAPFDAVVLTKNADVGDIVTPLGAAANAKAAVVTIADLDSLQVEADVSESNMAKVRPGQPCEIMLDALPDKRIRGKVHTVVPTADRSKATVLVKIAFVDRESAILPEMSAKVAFLERPVGPNDIKPRMVAPAGAIFSTAGGHYAFVVRGSEALKVPVRIGRKIGDSVEILEGLKAGDKVVVKPLERMKERTRIRQAEK